VRNHPPDLINVALERIIEASLELPAYSTLDEMAANIRTEVNEAICAGIVARMGPGGRQRAQGLLDTAGSDGYADLVIGEDGVPALKRHRSAGAPEAAERLAEAVARRMPERSLLSIVARTAYWLGWHHHFGPASGSDPKISDPLGRYCMAVFTGGVNIGPYEAARHIARGVGP